MTDQARFVKVVVDVHHAAVDQLYEYRVPSEWGRLPCPGCRVLVPFGKRRAVGLVWEEHEHTERDDLKSIIDVLDEQPLLTPEQIRLCDWIAASYLALRVEAIRLFLPPGANLGSQKNWFPVAAPAEIQRRITTLPVCEESKKLLWSGLEKTITTKMPFQTKEPEVIRALQIMTGEGYLKAQWVPAQDRIRPKTERVIRLPEKFPAKLTPKQNQVFSLLQKSQNQTYTIPQLAKAAGVTEGVIRRMVSQGLLALEERVVTRSVWHEDADLPPLPKPTLTPEQDAAFQRVLPGLCNGGFQAFLLHGVTGSGKTEIYLRLLEETIARGKQGIFLVPEIALTPQTTERVRRRLGSRVAILHSRLSEGERYDQWLRIHSGEVDVVVGARSALFAQLQRVGLIILDEEHEYSYKQEESPRYHTREVALEYCRQLGATLILGSATPSLESWRAVEEGELIRLHLSKRVAERPLPPVVKVDMRSELKEKHYGVLSRRLREELSAVLSRKEQAILLLNRRGFATFVLCRECGHAMKCPHCDVSLTYHQRPSLLKCHYCGYAMQPPDICPNCQSRYIKFFGQGTQRLEEEVRELFPQARTARMDLDTTSRKGAHEKIYRALVERKIDILIGTQMVAKGLDLPGVTLVGVIAADGTLHIPDFRSVERTYQLLTQVAGRAGRGEQPGKVLIQTYNPDHYCIEAVIAHDQEGFYRKELASRHDMGYPPYGHLVRFGLAGPDRRAVLEEAQRLGECLSVEDELELEMLGPAPAAVERVKDRFRWQIILKGKDLSLLRKFAYNGYMAYRKKPQVNPGVRVTVDVNPYSLL